MKHSVPTSTSGTAAHQAPSSRSPNASVATPRNSAVCTVAMPIVTTTRAPTTVRVLTGASCSRRSSPLWRQPCSVAAAPTAAFVAIAHPSRPGVKYWMTDSDSSSTCSTCRAYGGAAPASSASAPTLAPSTSARSVAWVTAACTWSVWV